MRFICPYPAGAIFPPLPAWSIPKSFLNLASNGIFFNTRWLKDLILKFSWKSWKFLITNQFAIVQERKNTAQAYLWCSLLHENVEG